MATYIINNIIMYLLIIKYGRWQKPIDAHITLYDVHSL